MATKVRKIIAINSGDIKEIRRLLAKSEVEIIKELPLVNALLVELPATREIGLVVRGLEDQISIEEDLEFKLCFLFPWFMPPRPIYPPQEMEKPSFPLPNKGRVDWGLRRIGAPTVWEKLKERRVRVGIIDTGITDTHPDLQANIKECTSTLDGNSSFLDDNGHGTHVAGTIGARSTRGGMVGINPYTDFYIVKAFDRQGSAKLSDIIEGIDWLIRRQVNVINMSFSTAETNNIFSRAIQEAYFRGTVLVAAAGNDGGTNSVNYPAKYSEVIAVSATDSRDNLASFSSTGPEVDFCAPGVDIKSTWLRSGYKVSSGTSFAAPHIAGAAADLLNYYGPMSPDQVKGKLASGAVALDGLSEEQQGAGIVELTRIIN